MAPLEPGLTGVARLLVTERDTARAHRSGDLEVLATPRLLALLEEAACAAIASGLGGHETSVGVRAEIDHLSPTPIGLTAVARSRLVAVEGRRLRFELSAEDERGAIARGSHERVLVDRARFLERAH